ncbi:uncharacterized protein DUF4846 [Flagellimonas meridianipacifica]|uniref:Uncharacterized protein DUF4846 n=2 Tax=Flagellimonas meridianipacifica TaxID=1080225 RepID=A0A2T0MK57_9FLAO|nr:uncharacterized protein DUF4846 [Allomuricauda pacifica]
MRKCRFFCSMNMKKLLLIVLGISLLCLVVYKVKPVKHTVTALVTEPKFINEDSLTIVSRVNVPVGYERIEYPDGSFEEYLRNYKLKPYGSKIINYDGTEYFWQYGHIGILEIPVPENGLQQCADALIRIRSEYLWENDRKEEIGFNFTSGHHCAWKQYAEGYRPKIDGNKVSFHKIALPDDSKANFYRYLNLVYTYAGTLSLYHELPRVENAKDLKLGDMLIKGGSPGHIVMICDEAVNSDGEKVYLLFQGNTPAQNIHLVKNLEEPSMSPWYTLEKDRVIPVSNYTFQSSKFVRFK